jgi:hypothetical protein
METHSNRPVSAWVGRWDWHHSPLFTSCQHTGYNQIPYIKKHVIWSIERRQLFPWTFMVDLCQIVTQIYIHSIFTLEIQMALMTLKKKRPVSYEGIKQKLNEDCAFFQSNYNINLQHWKIKQTSHKKQNIQFFMFEVTASWSALWKLVLTGEITQ